MQSDLPNGPPTGRGKATAPHQLETNRAEARNWESLDMRPLEFGWYLPTHGDTTAYGVASAQIAGSPELCDRVVQAAEAAGFEYLLIPVGSTCWEAWIAGAFMAGGSSEDKPRST